MNIRDVLSIPARVRYLFFAIKELLKQNDEYQKRNIQYIEFSELQMEAAFVHRETFYKYRKINEGKDVAIIGSGPTLDKWRPKEDIVQIGVNGSFLSSNVQLDYWFMQDFNLKMITKAEEYLNNDCKKFFGLHYMIPNVKPIPLVTSERMGAERYFFYDNPVSMFPFDFTIDIASRPFITYGSTIFVALQFALYTHPKRIYIVGCDCSTGHFSSHESNLHNRDVGHMDVIMEGWRKFAQFSSAMYPDIDIVSINPIGLKGIFRDEYTE